MYYSSLQVTEKSCSCTGDQALISFFVRISFNFIKSWINHFEHFTYNLKIWNADVEALIHIGMPHNPNIGNKKGS